MLLALQILYKLLESASEIGDCFVEFRPVADRQSNKRLTLFGAEKPKDLSHRFKDYTDYGQVEHRINDVCGAGSG